MLEALSRVDQEIWINWYISMEARNYRVPELPNIDWLTDNRVTVYLSIGQSDDSPINTILPLLKTGWVCLLDDDNIMHPNYLREIIRQPYPAICIYHQQLSRILEPVNPLIRQGTKCEIGSIDTAQFTIAAELISYGWDAEHEQPDGKFINNIYNKHPALLRRIDDVLCYYNYLSKPARGARF